MGEFDIRNDSLLSIDDICTKLSVSRSTLDRWRGDNRSFPVSYLNRNNSNEEVADFPPPTLYFGKSPRWAASVINMWLASQRPKPTII